MTLEAGLIRAPEIRGGEWINSPPLQLRDLRGRVVLIDFWDYYRAAEVNAVLRSTVDEQPITAFLTQDGAPLHPEEVGADVVVEPEGASYLWVDRPRMYNLIRRERLGAHELRLSSTAGLAVHAFTFVSCVVPAEELPATSAQVYPID